MNYLLFRLYGPMASWGDIAVGESRHSHSEPTKSAVMGLLAAALGIRREEEETHLALNRHYAMAAAVWQQGQLLSDFHTIQAADSVGKFRYRTRRDELILGRNRLGTVLSKREYRTDALAWIALSADENAPFSLQQLADALKTPKFVLYLGRKSCPFAAPLAPTLLQAEGFHQAFKLYNPGALSYREQSKQPNGGTIPDNLLTGKEVAYVWEGELHAFSPELDPASVITFTRHDRLLSRLRWQFTSRNIHQQSIVEGL